MHKNAHELLWLAAGTLGAGVVLKILLPLSEISDIARLIAGVFWLFVLPGWCLLLPWQKDIELLERAVVGILAAAGLFAIASYYFGIAGLHIRTHTILFPLLTIILSGAIAFWHRKSKKQA